MSTHATKSDRTLNRVMRSRWISAVLDANVAAATMMSASESPRKGLLKSGPRGFTIRVKSRSGSSTLTRRESRPPLSLDRERLPRRAWSVSSRPWLCRVRTNLVNVSCGSVAPKRSSVFCRTTSRDGRQNRSLQQASDERRARLGTHAHLLPWSSLLPAWAALPWSALLPPFPLLPALPLLPWSSLLPVWALLPWSSLLPAWAWLPWLSLLPALAWLPWSSLLAWPALGAQTRPGAIRASSSSISSVNSMVLSCTFQYGPQNGCQPRSQSLPANGHLLSGLAARGGSAGLHQATTTSE